MIMSDVNGRPYARMDELSPEDTVEVDGDFDCMHPGERKVIRANAAGDLFVICDRGRHMLDGQLNDDGELVGVYLLERYDG
jgi:hypothetical protein